MNHNDFSSTLFKRNCSYYSKFLHLCSSEVGNNDILVYLFAYTFTFLRDQLLEEAQNENKIQNLEAKKSALL